MTCRVRYCKGESCAPSSWRGPILEEIHLKKLERNLVRNLSYSGLPCTLFWRNLCWLIVHGERDHLFSIFRCVFLLLVCLARLSYRTSLPCEGGKLIFWKNANLSEAQYQAFWLLCTSSEGPMEDKEITPSVIEEDLCSLICTVTCFRMVLKLNSLTDVLVIQISPCNFNVVLY